MSTLERMWGTCLDVAPMEVLRNVGNPFPTLVPLEDSVDVGVLAWGFALRVLDNVHIFARGALMIFNITHYRTENFKKWAD